MWIIERNHSQVRTLTPGEIDLLEGFVDDSLSGQAAERANSLLRRVRQDGHWLGCGCMRPMPILHVALMESGRLVLRNNRDGYQHDEACTFRHEKTSSQNDDAANSRRPTRMDASGHIALHGEFSQASKGEVCKISRSSASGTVKSQSKLLSLLMSIYEAAGLTTWSPAKKLTVAEQFAALRAASRTFTLFPGLPMEAYLDTRITKQRLVAMSVKLKAASAFGKARRVGVLIDVIDSVQGRKAKLLGGEVIDFFGHLERQSPLSSPVIALATVTPAQPNSHFYDLGHVAALPVLSRTELFPVNDDEERALVHDVFRLLDWLHRTKGLEVVAMRRFFSSTGADLLELRSRKLILHIDLSEPLHGDSQEPPVTMPETLRLCDFDGIDALKRVIAGRFIGAQNG